MMGKSMLKAMVAEQMLTTITTDVANRFRARCVKLCLALGVKDKKAAAQVVNALFFGGRTCQRRAPPP